MEEETKSSEQLKLEEVERSCFCFNSRKSARALTQFYDRYLQQASGLRATQFNILVVVALARRVPLTRLAEILGMDRTTLTRNLKLIEGQALVTMEAGVDRRMHMISLTERGEALLHEALPYWQQAQEEMQQRLPQSGDALLTALHSVSAAL